MCTYKLQIYNFKIFFQNLLMIFLFNEIKKLCIFKLHLLYRYISSKEIISVPKTFYGTQGQSLKLFIN